jgi:hypothetical protein
VVQHSVCLMTMEGALAVVRDGIGIACGCFMWEP